jgi:hypothetical protein
VGGKQSTASFALDALLIAGVAAFGLALVVLLAANPLRDMHRPLYTARVNQRLDLRVRVAVISVSSQADTV